MERGSQISESGLSLSHKFVGQVDRIFSALPKSKDWRSFYNNDLGIAGPPKGQRAMRVAMMYPEPAKLKRKGSSSLKIKEQTDGINSGLLSQARFVLRHNPGAAREVLKEAFPSRPLRPCNADDGAK